MGVREQLLAATPRTAVLTFPDLDLSVTVRGMTGKERIAFELASFEGHGKHRTFNPTQIRERLVAYGCRDEHGARVFTDDDIVALGDTRVDVLDAIAAKVLELSGMGAEEVAELGKFSASRTASSTSSSVSPLS